MTEPRYLIMAKPTGLVSDNLQARLEGLGLVGTLGPGEVDRSNWHQSLSDRYWPSEMPDLEFEITTTGSETASSVSIASRIGPA